MDDRARRMYFVDGAVIWISLVAMWAVLGFTLRHVLPLTDDQLARGVICGAAALAGVFATSALIALLLHLRRERASLYAGAATPSTPS
jgi:hypothetical protein